MNVRSLLACCVAACLLYSCSSTTAPQATVGSIAGKVFDTSLTPIAQATIATDPPTSQFLSGQDGSFKFDNVLPGVYLLTAEKGLDLSGTASVRVLAGQTSYADIVLSPFGNNEGLLKGKVSDQGQQPVADASISTIPPSVTTKTAADGSFTIAHILAGNYTLVAEKLQVGKASEQITIKEGETVFKDIVLDPKADLDFGSLIAYYSFEGNGNDLSGNGHNLMLVDDAYSPSRFGDNTRALLANGLTTNGTAPHDEVYNATTLSVAVWMKLPRPVLVAPVEGMSIFSHYVSASGNGFSLFFYGNEIEWFYGGSGGFSYCKADIVLVADTTWHLVVATADVNAGTKLYIDGVKVKTEGRNNIGTPTQTSPFELCDISSGPKGKLFDGAMDDLRIYSKVLSDAEVQLLWADK